MKPHLLTPVLFGERGPLANILSSLVSYWKLDEASDGSGAVARADSHGTNHLTDNNTTPSSAGKLSNCADFTAANSETLSCLDNASLSTGNIDFTIAFWLNLDAKPGADTTIISKYNTVGNQREWRVGYVFATDRIEFRVSSNGTLSTGESADVLGAPATGTWYFVVVWHDAAADTLNIQVNNGVVDSAAYAGGVFDSTASFVVASQHGATAEIDGKVDEIGFWKRVLTPAERTSLYNGGTGLTYPF